MTARNGRVPFVDACRTVATELRERNLGVPREMRGEERDGGRTLGDSTTEDEDAADVVVAPRSPEEFLSLFDGGGKTTMGSPSNDVEAALAKLRGDDSPGSDRPMLDPVGMAALLERVLPSSRVVVVAKAATGTKKSSLVRYEFASGDRTVPKMTLSVDEAKHDDLLRRSKEWLTTRAGGADDRRGAGFLTSAFLVRVTAFSYLPASGFLYWGFGPDLYRYAEEALNAKFELYANPFNRTLEKFCSPFDLDEAFGSMGSLYGVDWTDVPELLAERGGGDIASRRAENNDSSSGERGGSDCAASGGGAERQNGSPSSSSSPVDSSRAEDDFVTLIANPPYVETELELCARTIREVLQRGDGAAAKNVLVLSVGPAWYRSEGIRTMRSGIATRESENAAVAVDRRRRRRRRIRKVLERELAPEEQRYYNYQTLESVPATHPGVAFAYANFSPGPEVVDRIERFFEHMGLV